MLHKESGGNLPCNPAQSQDAQGHQQTRRRQHERVTNSMACGTR
ncbi:MAG: hypothetical protein JETT_1926 [Candidatus Jettenia ecosi]|uniref:Uncharacterized protein n=1 Tax=Candidatus Jettenia ecosi TaxID=2494326 RepID=A0A533QAU2_9BACT|nr:MAG: hypothetical protein JETT_1926 [Candidatus Jettenia ecosi]